MGRSSKATVAHLLLVGAAVLYAGFIWEIFAGYPLDPSRSYLSELAAADQSTSLAFRALDGVSAALVLGALALLRPVGRTWRDPLRWGAVGLAIFALGTIADAVFPMECASSVDRRCALAEQAGTLGLMHQVHTVTSVLAFAGIVVAVLMTTFTAWRTPGLSPRARVGTFVLAALLLAGTAAGAIVAVLTGDEGMMAAGSGYILRGQVVLVCLFIATVGPLIAAIGVARAASGADDRAPEPAVQR